jgi:hypothetical protein
MVGIVKKILPNGPLLALTKCREHIVVGKYKRLRPFLHTEALPNGPLALTKCREQMVGIVEKIPA